MSESFIQTQQQHPETPAVMFATNDAIEEVLNKDGGVTTGAHFISMNPVVKWTNNDSSSSRKIANDQQSVYNLLNAEIGIRKKYHLRLYGMPCANDGPGPKQTVINFFTQVIRLSKRDLNYIRVIDAIWTGENGKQFILFSVGSHSQKKFIQKMTNRFLEDSMINGRKVFVADDVANTEKEKRKKFKKITDGIRQLCKDVREYCEDLDKESEEAKKISEQLRKKGYLAYHCSNSIRIGIPPHCKYYDYNSEEIEDMLDRDPILFEAAKNYFDQEEIDQLENPPKKRYSQ